MITEFEQTVNEKNPTRLTRQHSQKTKPRPTNVYSKLEHPLPTKTGSIFVKSKISVFKVVVYPKLKNRF